jgi:hypothetical protein
VSINKTQCGVKSEECLPFPRIPKFSALRPHVITSIPTLRLLVTGHAALDFSLLPGQTAAAAVGAVTSRSPMR